MEGDRIRIRCLNKLFRALIVVFTLLQCAVNPSLSLGFKNISSEGVVRCFEREREALLAFKHGLVDHYHLLSSWGREEHKQDCCKWVGVHCSNRTNHVTQLHLGWYSLNETYSHQQKGDTQLIGYFLQGKMMSPKLLELQHLKYLDLSSINFNGTRLPYFIGSLSNLRHLDLNYASFGGRFPSQVGNLTHLQYLDLSRNGFNSVENLNSWLPRLSSLTYLDLSSTNLSNVHDWLETVSKLPKLTNLTLQWCGLPSPVIHSSTLFNINSSKSLAHVDLSYNQCTSPSIYLWLSNYNASLVYLDLSNSSLTGLIPSVVENLTSLVYLELSYNKIDAVNPHSFSSLCSLQSLYLANTSLSGQFSEFVQMLSTCVQNSLESLYLSNNHLSGSIPDLTNFSSLKVLSLSRNQLSGTIPESIGHLSNLEYMDLSMNALEGVVSESIGQLSNLESMDLSMNALKTVVSESHFSNLSRLRYLDLSSNLLVLNFSSNWVPPFKLMYIYLRSCKMGPYFPKWLQTQNVYSYLDISDAGIVDILPSWFWGTTRDVTFISLSNNQIGEMFANSTMNFTNYPRVQLSSNQIEGPIPSTLSHASYLDLSNNNISGSISILCEAYRSLMFLNLSSNNLSGELPKCLTHFDNLVMLDLSYNAFWGKIPSTVGSLYHMETLKLRSNRFVGEFPSSFKNCTSLKVIDVGYNELSGPIPKWLGVSLQKLVVLMLSSNNFNGSLPSELCRLTNIQNLDVSANNISGTIPKCLNNFTVLAQKGNSSPTLQHWVSTNDLYFDYKDDATFVWKGRMYSYRNTLGLVKRIDFSSNRLTGEIPIEITYLVGLISLNLSINGLTGELPAKIGKLQALEILDLSRNQIDGRIPTSLARIDRLSILDLSYNNFNGKIPTGTQLQSFDPSNYAGNPQLCGPPLQNMCDDQQETVISSNEEENDELITWGFYVSMALGFIVGFWGVCGSLIFIRQWRYSYIRFLNVLNDWLYVKVISIKRHFN